MDWIGVAGTLLGLELVARKRRAGFVVGALGCLAWSIYSLQTAQWALLTVNALILMVPLSLNDLRRRGFVS